MDYQQNNCYYTLKYKLLPKRCKVNNFCQNCSILLSLPRENTVSL